MWLHQQGNMLVCQGELLDFPVCPLRKKQAKILEKKQAKILATIKRHGKESLPTKPDVSQFVWKHVLGITNLINEGEVRANTLFFLQVLVPAVRILAKTTACVAQSTIKPFVSADLVSEESSVNVSWQHTRELTYFFSTNITPTELLATCNSNKPDTFQLTASNKQRLTSNKQQNNQFTIFFPNYFSDQQMPPEPMPQLWNMQRS
jgi:hypothetical protein